jgi:protein-disulfide isomerase
MTTSKRDAIRAQRLKKQRKQRMNTILWVGGFILLLVLILSSYQIYLQLKPAGSFTRITPEPRPLENGLAMGNPDAKVKIEVFEDFQCPACKEFTDLIETQLVQSTYISSGQVYYIYRQYPILDSQSATKESHQAANASMCANAQGQFWAYHDILFANQSGENLGAFNDKRLEAFAQSLGLDMTAFDKCFKADTYKAEIDADIQIGQAYGVQGTPTIFLNGAQINPITYSDLKSSIDAALAGGG